MDLSITEQNLKQFAEDIWKDFRKLEVSKQGDQNIIRRFPDHATSIAFEIWFINQLRGRVRFQIPKIIEHNDHAISFEYIRGTRAFNLLVDLRTLYREDKENRYLTPALELISLLEEDLSDFQKNSNFSPNKEFTPTAYPAYQKLESVYTLLGSVLGFDVCLEDLQKISELYLKITGVPFRDATTKNVILNIPTLYQANFNTYQDRLVTLKKMIQSGELKPFLQRSQVYHIDFSGCQYLCPKQDDWLAVREHQGSNWLNQPSSQDLDKLTNEELCVIFVRFTRFGGRKLLYRLLNYKGYKVRFCFDQEAYYFRTLKRLCRILLERGFLADDSWYKLMTHLEEATAMVPTKDHFLTWKNGGNLSLYYSDVFPG